MRIAALGLVLATAAAAPAGGMVELPLDETGPLFASTDGSVTLRAHSPYRALERVPGVTGQAVRFDGYSTWLEGAAGGALAGDAFTIELWLAVAHYPVETAGLVGRDTLPDAGVRLGLDPWGRLRATVATTTGLATASDGTALPTGRWHHVALTLDPAGRLRLLVDGELVGEAALDGDFRPAEDAPLTIGRNAAAGLWREVFEQGVLNGVIDAVTLHGEALSVARLAERAKAQAPAGPAPTGVPADRFAEDPARPAYHPLPATGWTNEPHGLIHDGERYRLFYQANPNGPFWSRIRWGQLTSPDLVRWTQEQPALVPEPGFDEVGIWVGNTFLDDAGALHAAYTGVNGVKAGIGMAVAGEEGLRKAAGNPVLTDSPEGFKDFRDPFVWREGDGWSMLVGSGRLPPHERGVALRYRSDDLRTWRYEGTLDTGIATVEGVYWEVPSLQPLAGGRHALFVTTVERGALARGLYWLGSWNGRTFAPDTALPRAFDVFHRMLSPTFARTPDGRLVAIGIVAGTQSLERRRARGWVHSFSLPRQVWACPEAGLCQAPLRELSQLRGERVAVGEAALGATPHRLALGPVPGDRAELVLEIDPAQATELVLELRATPDGRERSVLRLWPRLGWAELDLSQSSSADDVGRDRFDGRITPIATGETLTLRVFVDHSVVDVFLGETDAFSFRTFPTSPDAMAVRLRAHGGKARLVDGEAFTMAATPIR